MTCGDCGKDKLTANTAVASGMVPDLDRLYCKCPAPASCSEVVERLPITKHTRSPQSADSAPNEDSSSAAKETRESEPVIWVQRDFAPGYEQWWVMLDWPEFTELLPILDQLSDYSKKAVIVQRYSSGEECRLLAEARAEKLRKLLAKSDEWREQIRKGANH